MTDQAAPQWALALLALAWGGSWLAAIWACWTGRWKGLADGHTGDAWNTILLGQAVSFVLVGITLATGAGWPLIPAAAAFVLGVALYLVGAFVDLRWLQPRWEREHRGFRRRDR